MHVIGKFSKGFFFNLAGLPFLWYGKIATSKAALFTDCNRSVSAAYVVRTATASVEGRKILLPKWRAEFSYHFIQQQRATFPPPIQPTQEPLTTL